MKKFKAWTRRKGSGDRFVTTEINRKTKKEAIQYFKDNGYEIDGKVYLAK